MNPFMMIMIILVSFSVVPAVADDERRMESEKSEFVTLPAGEVINRDYFAAGQVVEILGTVNGDVYAAGGRVIINGRINGDLLVAGGTVIIGGRVAQDVRAAGGRVIVNGTIGRNLTAAGGDIDLTDSAEVSGGIVAAGGTIGLAALVCENVKIAAGSVTVSGPIQGSLDLAAGEIILTSGAFIDGDLTYRSGRPATIDRYATIGGTVTHRGMPDFPRPSAGTWIGALVVLVLLMKVVSFISTLILGLLMITLFPGFTRAAVSTLQNRPWASLGWGLVALVLTPVIAGILAATVLGLPLALMLTAVYLVSIYLARVFAIYWAGSALFERLGKEVRPVWVFLIGLVAYSVLALIPFIGGSLALLMILLGLGAALLTQRDLYGAAGKAAI